MVNGDFLEKSHKEIIGEIPGKYQRRNFWKRGDCLVRFSQIIPSRNSWKIFSVNFWRNTSRHFWRMLTKYSWINSSRNFRRNLNQEQILEKISGGIIPTENPGAFRAGICWRITEGNFTKKTGGAPYEILRVFLEECQEKMLEEFHQELLRESQQELLE